MNSGALNIVIFIMLGIGVLSMVRLIFGPTPEDRMIGLNLVAGQVLAIMVLVAVRLAQPLYLDVALAYSILGFVGILALSRYFERRSGP